MSHWPMSLRPWTVLNLGPSSSVPKAYYGPFSLPYQSAGRWLPWLPSIPSLSRDRATNKLPRRRTSATRAPSVRPIPRNVSHIRIDFRRKLLFSTFCRHRVLFVAVTPLLCSSRISVWTQKCSRRGRSQPACLRRIHEIRCFESMSSCSSAVVTG
jgi:hypothetical protein